MRGRGRRAVFDIGSARVEVGVEAAGAEGADVAVVRLVVSGGIPLEETS